jgi:hypothetical protein
MPWDIITSIAQLFRRPNLVLSKNSQQCGYYVLFKLLLKLLKLFHEKEDVLQRKGLKDKIHITSKNFATQKEVEEISLDPKLTIISMRVLGSGDKFLRSLLKDFGQLKLNVGFEKKDKRFWRK